MSINFGELGSFNKILDLYLKENGGWVSVEEVYYKEEGSWVKVYPGEEVGGGGKTVDPLILWSLRENKSGTDDLTDAARPMNLQAAFVSNGVDLSWEVFNPDIVEKYEIHRADDPEGSYTKVGESTSKQFVDTSIPEGEYKFYKARSVLKNDGSFSEFSKPEYGHLVNIEIDSTNVPYSSSALTTVGGNVSSFGQVEVARPALKWKKSSASSFQEKEPSGLYQGTGNSNPKIDLKVKYSNSSSSSVYIDDSAVNDGNDSGSFDKVITNGGYVATKTKKAVRLWDLSFNPLDTITYPDASSDPGSNVIEDIAIRGDGYVGIAKRNDAGDSNAIEVFEIDNNGNLTQVFGSSEPGGFTESNYGYSVAFRQFSGLMAVGNVDGEIYYYNGSFNKIEKRNYSFTSSNDDLHEFYELGYREYDGMLYAVRRQSGNRDSLLIVDSSRNVLREALSYETAVAGWNNFDGPNAGYLVGMNKGDEKFHIWDASLNKVGAFEVHPNGYTDHYPTSVTWRPDGGLLFTFDNGGFYATHDSNFNLIQRKFPQKRGDGSTNAAAITDGTVLPNNKIFISYDIPASNSPAANTDLEMLSSYEIGSELSYENNYDVRLGLKNKGSFYPANSTNTFDTNVAVGPDTPPGDITFDSFEVRANQKRKTIVLSWLVSDGRVPDSYNIYRAGSQNGSYSQIANVTGGNAYFDSPGIGEYFYHVQIVESGNEYNQSTSKPAELRPTNDFYLLDRNGSGLPYATQFRLTSPWELDKGVFVGEMPLDYAIGGGNSGKNLYSAQSFSFKSDGSRLFILRNNGSSDPNAGVWQITLQAPYQVSDWQSGSSEFFDMDSQVSDPNGMHFRPDGSQVFVSEQDTMNIYEYQLGTSWDITTSSFIRQITLDDPNQSGEAISGEIEFRSDGSELFVTLSSGDIAKFVISTPWDLTTASFQSKEGVSGNTDGIYIAEDGSRFYTATADGTITENLMKTNWDVTSKVKMNSAEYVERGSEEQVDLNFRPPQENFDIPKNIQTYGDQNSGEMVISWISNSSSGVDHYNVYRADDSGGSFSKINSSNVNGVYYIDQNVTQFDDYYYKVSSVVNGSETQLSKEAKGRLAVPQIFYDGFESGVSNWTINGALEQKYRSYEGTYSIGCETRYDGELNDAVTSISPTQISEISWYWQADGTQYGSALSLYNSNGDRELSVGTKSKGDHKWSFWDATGFGDSIYDTGVYNKWMYVKLSNFDWSSKTYDYYYENTNSGHVETGTRSMNHGIDVSEIWLGLKPDPDSERLYCWWDEIEVLG